VRYLFGFWTSVTSCRLVSPFPQCHTTLRNTTNPSERTVDHPVAYHCASSQLALISDLGLPKGLRRRRSFVRDYGGVGESRSVQVHIGKEQRSNAVTNTA
jgi:hypothetical protein